MRNCFVDAAEDGAFEVAPLEGRVFASLTKKGQRESGQKAVVKMDQTWLKGDYEVRLNTL